MSWQSPTTNLPPVFDAASISTPFLASTATAPHTDAALKRRTIPNHLVVRGLRKANDTPKVSLDANHGYHNTTGFGTGRNLPSSFSSVFAEGNDDDAPPLRSIYDLREDDVGTADGAPVHQLSQKDPKEFTNVFQHSFTAAGGSNPSATTAQTLTPMTNGESAVLVFGYPESMSNEVISHFSQYGQILEDFAIIRNRPLTSTPSKGSELATPIFSGESWVKLTYDNPASAMRAMEDNGIYYNGSLVGVVGYTRAAVEKLTSRKISNREDVGETVRRQMGPMGLVQAKDEVMTESSALHNSSLALKDGRSLFYNDVDESKKGVATPVDETVKVVGVLGLVGKYVFGFNEI